MFDAHIQYYAYNNVDDDDFGVGYLGNKEDWIERINRWNNNDGIDEVRTVEDWDDLECIKDFRGIQLAEVEPDGDSQIVSWANKNREYSVEISKKGEATWIKNPTKLTTVPRWTNRMRTMLREARKS